MALGGLVILKKNVDILQAYLYQNKSYTEPLTEKKVSTISEIKKHVIWRRRYHANTIPGEKTLRVRSGWTKVCSVKLKN